MTYSLPFIYLPDAVTLILLLVAFQMLRKIAVDHIRQELSLIREKLLLYWLLHELDLKEAGYIALRNIMDASMEMAPMLSPARLAFISRLQRKKTREGAMSMPFDPSCEVGFLIEGTLNEKGRDTLKKLQTEMNLGLGMFFLMGSLSGWLLLFSIVVRILKRTVVRHGNHPIDFFFNVFERMLDKTGRQAQQTGCLRQLFIIMPQVPASTGRIV